MAPHLVLNMFVCVGVYDLACVCLYMSVVWLRFKVFVFVSVYVFVCASVHVCAGL